MVENDARDQDFLQFVERYDADAAARLGPYANATWTSDPRLFFFFMSRCKFCSKVLAGAKTLLNLGCGDAFFTPLLLQTVGRVVGVDIAADIIDYNNKHYTAGGRAEFHCRNIVDGPLEGGFDAAMCLDVIEHIHPEWEDAFVANLATSLLPHSPCVVGTPNVTAFTYASDISKASHINLKGHAELTALLKRHFHNVFLFSMNDEVVHTGFYPMAHYLMALAVDPKR